MKYQSPFRMTEGDDGDRRMTILIWGPAGVGKSTFAATAPGKKLWLSLGDGEHLAVIGRTDVRVMHLYEYDYEEVIKQGKSTSPFGLDHILAEDESIQTVVVDSVTALVDLALRYAVDHPSTEARKFSPTIEFPGLLCYGGRNTITNQILYNIMRITAKHGVHLIMTAHEADPEKDKAGDIQFFTVMLGGKIVNTTTRIVSEFWYMSDDGRGRQIAVRPTRKRKPMKSRMFRSSGESEFVLDYNADKPDKGQMTIASWFEAWLKSEGKLDVPKSRRDK